MIWRFESRYVERGERERGEEIVSAVAKKRAKSKEKEREDE